MTHETVPLNRRLYLIFEPADAGKTSMRLSLSPPNVGQAMAALIVRGVLMDGAVVDIDFISDPKVDPDLRGAAGKDGTNGRDGVDGKSGTDGKAGTNGADGQSVYDLARSLGYGGTKTQFLASLVGASGKDGKDGSNGTDGTDGKNASAILGTVNIAQTATIAVSAGTRRMILAIPASWGVVAGDPLIALPSAAPAGYAVHDVIAVSATSLSIGITAPLLAIGASFSIPCRIARLNT